MGIPGRAALGGMLRTDGLRVVRDRFLVGMIVYILGISIAIRWALPWLAVELDARFAFDFTSYYALAVSHVVIQLAPLLGGIIGGFLLLEAKEEGTLRALLVAPVPLTAYLTVLGAVLSIASASLAVVEGYLIGLGLPPVAGFFGAAAVGAPGAVIFALIIGAYAENKTQAFAFMKIIGFMPLVATGAYFAPEPWQWLLAVYPPYCASKAYWVAEAGGSDWPVWVGIGVVGAALWIAALQRSFLRAARR